MSVLFWNIPMRHLPKGEAVLDENGVDYATGTSSGESHGGGAAGVVGARGRAGQKALQHERDEIPRAGLKDRLPEMDEEALFALLGTDGMLVKRPLVVGADFCWRVSVRRNGRGC